jgi:hypothetical protein
MGVREEEEREVAVEVREGVSIVIGEEGMDGCRRFEGEG